MIRLGKLGIVTIKRFHLQMIDKSYIGLYNEAFDVGRGVQSVPDAISRNAVEGFYLECRSRNVSPRTWKYYQDNLRYLRNYASIIGRGLCDLTTDDIRRYLASVPVRPYTPTGLSQATINARIRTWRRFYNHLVEDGILRQSPMERIKQGRLNHEFRKLVSADDIKTLINSFDTTTFFGERNRNIVLLLYDTMIRVGELCNINLDDVDAIGGSIKVHGKGRRDRYVPICPRTAKSLHRYMTRQRRGTPGNFLFCYDDGRRMKEAIVYRTITRACDRAGIERIGPHTIRHSGATQYIVNGGPVGTLQKILGHSDIRTTQIYMHLSDRDVKESHQRFSPAANL